MLPAEASFGRHQGRARPRARAHGESFAPAPAAGTRSLGSTGPRTSVLRYRTNRARSIRRRLPGEPLGELRQALGSAAADPRTAAVVAAGQSRPATDRCPHTFQ